MENVTGVFVAFITAAGPLSILTTKGVDFLRNLLDSANSWPKWAWNVAALAIGVGLCVGWQFNLFGTLAHAIPAMQNSSTLDGVAGQLLTGLAVGGMAGYWHEKLDQLSSQAKLNQAAVPVAVQG